MTRDDPDLEIRPARPDDAPTLSGLLGELGFATAPETVVVRLEALLAAGEMVLVAARGGRVLGLVTLHRTPVLHRPTAVGRLTALVVDAAERGRGVGRALVAAAEAHLAARGCRLIEVTSNTRWTGAHAFYEHLGYERTSLRFKRDLPPPN